MTTPQRPITLADLEAVTGLGPKQVRKLVRLGRLPGELVGRSDYFCSPGEYDRWLRGDWEPKPQPTTMPVQMIRKRAS